MPARLRVSGCPLVLWKFSSDGAGKDTGVWWEYLHENTRNGKVKESLYLLPGVQRHSRQIYPISAYAHGVTRSPAQQSALHYSEVALQKNPPPLPRPFCPLEATINGQQAMASSLRKSFLAWLIVTRLE